MLHYPATHTSLTNIPSPNKDIGRPQHYVVVTVISPSAAPEVKTRYENINAIPVRQYFACVPAVIHPTLHLPDLNSFALVLQAASATFIILLHFLSPSLPWWWWTHLGCSSIDSLCGWQIRHLETTVG